jgi:signal transduction histidine kinase
MIGRAVHAVAAASVAALLAFSVLAYLRRVDVAACERYEQQLQALLALDFRLIAEVMKARSGAVGHYDGIVQTQAARKRLHHALERLPRGLAAGDSGELRVRLRQGARSRAESEWLVERWKREHAVLRNSLRYLTVLAADIDSAAAAQPMASGSVPAITAGLVRDALLLQSWQDDALIGRIDRAIAALAAAARGRTPPDTLLDTLLAHARLARERTPIVQDLTRAILEHDDAGLTRVTMVAFAARRKSAMQTADSDARVRLVLAMLVLASGAASIILRLRRDAASLRSTGAQLEQAIASLRTEQAKQKELADLKSRFVSMASHEFRTPLSVIVSSSEMLEAYEARWSVQKKQEHLSRIRVAALGMTRMLDAMLMIGRRDAGLLKFEPRPVAIDSFCSEVVETVGDATAQRHRVIYRGLPAEEQVLADPTLLRHVLENLLSNALKYSAEGSPVELQVRRETGELRFDVRDRGIGISEDDQKHLFETFHRGKNVGGVTGTGLGLAIVRGAVELHGGQVSVTSELNVGTEFTIRIPYAWSEA